LFFRAVKHAPMGFRRTAHVASSVLSPRAAHHRSVSSRDVIGPEASLSAARTKRRTEPFLGSLLADVALTALRLVEWADPAV
jgi:hypothetical protein